MSVQAKIDASEAAATAGRPTLQLIGIKKSFGAVRALKGVDLSILPCEVHAVVGENGAGKSTLLGIAAGVFGANEGRIVSDGQTIVDPNPRRMCPFRSLRNSAAWVA